MSETSSTTLNESNTTEASSPEALGEAQSQTPLEGAEGLEQAIRNQIEFYFSPQNLPSDAFLQANMDSDRFVPLELVSGFSKVKVLTTDPQVVVHSISTSTLLELSSDETKVRAKDDRKRNRLLLHGLHPDTTDKELEDLFQEGGLTPVIKGDVNNCWFATFESEDAASVGLEFIRQKTLHGQPIRGRFKSEPAQNRAVSFLPSAGAYSGPLILPGTDAWQIGGFASTYYNDPRGGYLLQQNTRGRGQRRGSHRGDPNRKPNEKKRIGSKKPKGARETKQAAVQLVPSDFPPLPSTNNASRSRYPKDLLQYTRQTLIEALTELTPLRPPSQGVPTLQEPELALENATNH